MLSNGKVQEERGVWPLPRYEVQSQCFPFRPPKNPTRAFLEAEGTLVCGGGDAASLPARDPFRSLFPSAIFLQTPL